MVDANRILQLYERLVRIFTAKGWSFERKLYASTSREGNKAMNLNSFIGLMGHSLKRVETSDGVILRDVREGESPDFVMRNSEYVLTLDRRFPCCCATTACAWCTRWNSPAMSAWP